MSKHTPGPWISDGNGLHHSWDVSNCGGSICTVTTNRADADLIATAPELLEAAKLAIDILDGVENGMVGIKHLLPADGLFAMRELKGRVQRIIKKAEGK